MPTFHDITRPLRTSLAPWPGDTAFDFRLTWRMDAGSSVNVGAVTMGTHNGTHADAPFHFLPDGARIDGVDPAIYIGAAVVADVTGAGWTIGRNALADAARHFGQNGVTRLLLKTGAWPDDTRFPDRIPLLAPDVPAWLGENGVRLLGLDIPSVDAIESGDLPIHHALAAAGVCILESLDLSAVAAGVYELIALPLKIAGGDAAPVRAILRSPSAALAPRLL